MFFDMGCDVVGIDIDDARLAKARERLRRISLPNSGAKRRPTYEFFRLDLNGEDWPLEEVGFGAVVIVHHYSARVIRKSLRLLRPGGMFFLETYGGQGGNWQDLPPKDFVRQLLDECGFEIEFYKERKVGPAHADAVSVRTFAVRK